MVVYGIVCKYMVVVYGMVWYGSVVYGVNYLLYPLSIPAVEPSIGHSYGLYTAVIPNSTMAI